MTIITVIEDMEDVIQEVIQLDDKVNIPSMLCIEAIFRVLLSLRIHEWVIFIFRCLLLIVSPVTLIRVLPSL